MVLLDDSKHKQKFKTADNVKEYLKKQMLEAQEWDTYDKYANAALIT